MSRKASLSARGRAGVTSARYLVGRYHNDYLLIGHARHAEGSRRAARRSVWQFKERLYLRRRHRHGVVKRHPTLLLRVGVLRLIDYAITFFNSALRRGVGLTVESPAFEFGNHFCQLILDFAHCAVEL